MDKNSGKGYIKIFNPRRALVFSVEIKHKSVDRDQINKFIEDLRGNSDIYRIALIGSGEGLWDGFMMRTTVFLFVINPEKIEEIKKHLQGFAKNNGFEFSLLN